MTRSTDQQLIHLPGRLLLNTGATPRDENEARNRSESQTGGKVHPRSYHCRFISAGRVRPLSRESSRRFRPAGAQQGACAGLCHRL